MRKLKHLSPSSLALWESNRTGFYLKHLAEVRPLREPQKDFMSIGSAFDAYVKADLYEACYGKGFNPQFEFDTIFTEQVEEHNRDWARKAGKYAYNSYRVSGAYADLLKSLERSSVPPQFEFTIEKEVYGVPLLGKPDCRYITPQGVHVILDWKVTGFCSNHGSTPYKFYSMIRDGWSERTAKPCRVRDVAHPKFKPMKQGDVEIGSHYLEESCADWADQLSIYGWMLDEPVGSEEVVTCIDQLACKPRKNSYPLIRVANHRARISKDWQEKLVARLCDCWNTCESGHIFTRRTREENDSLCEILEMQAQRQSIVGDEMDQWLNEISKPSFSIRKR